MSSQSPPAPNHTAGSEPARPATRFYNVRLSEADAWLGATGAVLFNGLGMLIEIGIIRKVPGVSETPAVISALAALVLLAALVARRKTPSNRWANVIFLINTAAVVTSLLISNRQFALLEPRWSPFQATKLGCLVAAMVAPGFSVGVVSIAAHSLSAVLQLEYFFPPELRTMTADEPLATLAFGLAGMLALVYRFRRVQLEQELARIQAENFAIRRLANAFLNIRDLMNTPLQVLELSVDVLRNAREPLNATLDRIRRSVQRLMQINSILTQHEKEIEWQARRRNSW